MALLRHGCSAIICALFLGGGCDLSDLQDGVPGGGGSSPAGGAPVGGAGGAPLGGGGGGGVGGAGGDCPALGPFEWTRAIGNELSQFTEPSDQPEDDPSSVRVASTPDGGFFVALTTHGALAFDELGPAIGTAATSLFVLRFDAAGTLLWGHAHTQDDPGGEPLLLLDDAVVRADGALVVSGHLGNQPLSLDGPSGPLSRTGQVANPDAFLATFDDEGFATDVVRLESSKPGMNAVAVIRGLAPYGQGVAVAGGYKQGLRLDGVTNASLPEAPDEPHGFVMLVDGADLANAPARAFRASDKSKIVATSVVVAQGGVVIAVDFDLTAAGETLTLRSTPDWALFADDKGYPDESLIIAMDGSLSPTWVALLQSSRPNVIDNVESLGIDPASQTLWALGSNDTSTNPDEVITGTSRIFTLAGMPSPNTCGTTYENSDIHALMAAFDAEGDCVSVDIHPAFSAAHASATLGGRLYIAGYASIDSFPSDSLESFDPNSQLANGFVASPAGRQQGKAVYDGVLVGGSLRVRIEDVAALDDGLVVVGSMGAGLMDAACPARGNVDLFVAKLVP